MGFKEIIERNPNLTLKDLQELQGTYDERFVAQKGFVGFAKVRHTYAHIGKLFGRLAGYIHDKEEPGRKDLSDEEIRTKVIPDLLVYSAWLADAFGVDIEQAYLTRFAGNLKRLHADKVSPEELEELDKCIGEKDGRGSSLVKRFKIKEFLVAK